MKLLLSLFGYISTTCLAVGYTLNLLNYSIGSKLFIYGLLALFLIFVPIYTLRKIRTIEKHNLIVRLKNGSGGLAGLIFGISALFKWMRWPGAEVLLLVSMLITAALFLPMLFMEMYKRFE